MIKSIVLNLQVLIPIVESNGFQYFFDSVLMELPCSSDFHFVEQAEKSVDIVSEDIFIAGYS